MTEPAQLAYPLASQPVRDVIASYAMRPLRPEGGWWTPGPRDPAASGILYLCADTADGFSALHRLAVAESWTWLAGAPLRLLTLDPGAPADADSGTRMVLDAAHPQALVPAGRWQGARPVTDWTLAACWCLPAYTDESFTLGVRERLAARYLAYAADIEDLTRDH